MELEHNERTTNSNGPRVVSLVGMGGIGKTALARKVYDSKDLSDMFSTRAWITVSQSFDQKELFKEMIMQLFGAESWDKFLKDHQGQVTEVHLAGYISRRLKETRRGASKENCKEFRDAAQKLSCLLSLNVGTKEWMKEAEPLDILVSFTSALLSLEKLKLKGLLKKIPAWVGKSVNLVKVDLKHCRLKELDALAGLPNLIRLRLYEYAYDAEKLVYCKDAFPKLRVLLLKAQHDVALREVTFEWSTSPNMETIRIENCRLASGINE
nr:unnamed protein product [Digitaria exilis]